MSCATHFCKESELHDEFTTGLIRTPSRRTLRRAGLREQVEVEKRAKDASLGEPLDSVSKKESPLIQPDNAEKSEFPESPSTTLDSSASYDYLGAEIFCRLCESDDVSLSLSTGQFGPP